MAAAVLITIWVASRFLPMMDWWPAMLDWIHGLGPTGFVIFFLLHALATVFFVPAIVFGMSAGLIYGFWQAFVLALVCAAVTGMASFYISRYMARDWVAAQIARNPKYASVDNAVGRQGWKIVLLTRLSPGFPYSLMNYAFGATRVSPVSFFLATLVGMAPRTFVHVYLGAVGASFATVSFEDAMPTPARALLVSIGLAATIIATVYISYLVRNALEHEPDEPKEPEANMRPPEMAVEPAE